MGKGDKGGKGGTLKPTFLLDASALYPLSKMDGAEKVAVRSVVLDLTLYEAGNAVWRDYRRGVISDWKVPTKALEDIFRLVSMQRIDPKDLLEIEELSVTTGLTFYDSSYLHYAKKLGLKLVTEDSTLAGRAGELAIRAKEALDMVR